MTLLPKTSTKHAETIRVRGIVQDVGFRPTVWKIAQQLGLCGCVSNDGDGVLIKLQGQSLSIDAFINCLSKEKPTLARIDSIERERNEYIGDNSQNTASSFEIIESNQSNANTGITADAATCDACLSDIFDNNFNNTLDNTPKKKTKENHRKGYPFTNCTHCGPRLSIIRGIPYDRAQTSMDEFEMCPSCLHEYNSPADRRFHAQPNACPNCGPHVWLEDNNGKLVSGSYKKEHFKDPINDIPITKAALCIRNKAIVAIKGIGGIHLAACACDDGNGESAIQKLRIRKKRPHKPFAIMTKDISMIEQYCYVSEKERNLLTSPAAPIVILKRRSDSIKNTSQLSNDLAPGQKTLGVMLPYSPIHHLLLNALNTPIVLTSANPSHEPQCIDNNHAHKTLSDIADYYLLHNRKIESRVDDSVVRIMAGKPQFYRRARGYAPESLPLPKDFEKADDILAMGGELKNTFCLIKNGQAILSQHMGDLENYKTYEDYRHNLSLYENLFQHNAKHIAVDSHPEYISNKAGLELAEERNITLHRIQHHHAHIASCLADNLYPLNGSTVLGIALDGLGYGSGDNNDIQLWGGEFLLADYQQSQRLAHFKAVALLGGSIAMKQPWRNTYAHLQTCLNNGNGWDWVVKNHPDLELVKNLSTKPLATFDAMMNKGLNCPQASSAGRLFDAVAGAIGICQEQIQYEGQAAIELESSITESDWLDSQTSAYLFDTKNELDPTPMWKGLLNDLSLSTPRGLISARFHKGLSIAIQTMAIRLAADNNIQTIALSGGVFQNKTLFEDVKQELEKQDFSVLVHRHVPANDGGIALGQAVITAARILSEKNTNKQTGNARSNLCA
ncbi:carbamoyltransferase HypF [Cocleimonas sp. KMM 6895]|uniref:carbamoyltransferase HypF n=1 Tax=Cocleimonas sp. KMM 6895 TaxID=2993581 RepID=UPI002DD624CF|nr:carbamoyltransferase HypF [Cocleimonas sp. KMM 6895]MEC4714530.1 carbamoyltransferase HypF [Cocleimonas sp. KMM 6895]